MQVSQIVNQRASSVAGSPHVLDENVGQLHLPAPLSMQDGTTTTR